MSRSDRVAEQTRIRLALLENGYVPLANRDKLCVLPRWNMLTIDKEQVEAWADSLRWQATGVRVEGGLVALDFDIDDADALDAIWDALPDDIYEVIEAAPVRRGKGEKLCLFARLADGEADIACVRSKAYGHPSGTPERHKLEVFGGRAARQIGCYGWHTLDQIEYRWVDGRGLAEMPLSSLPAISNAQIVAMCDVVSRVLDDLGWARDVRVRDGRVGEEVVFDLTDDMVFETLDHGDLSLGELEQAALWQDGSIRCSASWLEGPSAANRTRCLASINPADRRLQIYETAGGTLHRPEGLDVRGTFTRVGERMKALGWLAEGSGAAKGGGTVARMEPGPKALDEGYDEAWEFQAEDPPMFHVHLLDRYVWWPSGGGMVLPVSGHIEDAMSLASFRNTYANKTWHRPVTNKSGKKGGSDTEPVNPADEWLYSPDRVEVNGFNFVPTTSERLADVDGRKYVNTFRPLPHMLEDGEADVEAVAVFEAFLDHLIPDPRERDWFIMWLAAKTQKPHIPNCGVLMVGQNHGTGRGTLFDMLKVVFGHHHVGSPNATQLLGGEGQGQYTDWVADKLLVVCEEVLTGGDSASTMSWKRSQAYERLKLLVDPRPREVSIIRKTLPNTVGMVHASFLMATNHMNALQIPAEDRRLAVILNGAKLDERPDLMDALEPWRDDVKAFKNEMGAAIWHWLRGLRVDWHDVRESPKWMIGREAMIAANEGDLEDVLGEVMADVPGDFVLHKHLIERVGQVLSRRGLDHEIKNWRGRVGDMLSRANRFGWSRIMTPQRLSEGKDVWSMVYYRDSVGLDAWKDADLGAREALWKRAADPNQTVSKVEAAMQARGWKVAGE
jgi:hypothetical protein